MKRSKRERAVAQDRASTYWRSATTTFIASSVYYDRVEDALRHHVLPRLPRARRLADFGCGNGRFTLMLAQAAESVEAVDISQTLVAEAEREAARLGIRNIRFSTDDILDRGWVNRYDIIVCMGVTSIIVDERKFRTLVGQLAASLRPGGYLIVRDTLTEGAEDEIDIEKKRPSVYRSRLSYFRALARHKLRAELLIRLSRSETKRRENFLAVLRKPTLVRALFGRLRSRPFALHAIDVDYMLASSATPADAG